MTTTPTFTTRYMFSVQAKLDSYRLGETPAGFRVDVDYKGGTVTTDLVAYLRSWEAELNEANITVLQGVNFRELDRLDLKKKEQIAKWLQQCRRAPTQSARPRGIDWFGLEGTLISGSDWLLVRTDGVAEMDGRVTLQEETWGDQGGGLINTQLAAVVDLFSAQLTAENQRQTGERPPGSQVYEAWKTVTGASTLRFALAIRFAAAEASQPWASAEYRSLGGFWRFASLPLHQYTANVEASQNDGLINTINLDVWRTSFRDAPLPVRYDKQ